MLLLQKTSEMWETWQVNEPTYFNHFLCCFCQSHWAIQHLNPGYRVRCEQQHRLAQKYDATSPNLPLNQPRNLAVNSVSQMTKMTDMDLQPFFYKNTKIFHKKKPQSRIRNTVFWLKDGFGSNKVPGWGDPNTASDMNQSRYLFTKTLNQS